MPASLYHTGGHSLADLIRELYRLYYSLAEVQNELARQIISGEIVLLQELAQGWYLEWASVHEEGDGWSRSRRKIMIVVDGKQRDPAEFRYHSPLSEPRPPAPSEPAVEEEPPQPDADPPSTTTAEDSPAKRHRFAAIGTLARARRRSRRMASRRAFHSLDAGILRPIGRERRDQAFGSSSGGLDDEFAAVRRQRDGQEPLLVHSVGRKRVLG